MNDFTFYYTVAVEAVTLVYFNDLDGNAGWSDVICSNVLHLSISGQSYCT
jgi:hypothetical protein